MLTSKVLLHIYVFPWGKLMAGTTLEARTCAIKEILSRGKGK